MNATSAVGGLIVGDDWATSVTNRCKRPSRSSFASPSSWSTVACLWEGFAMLSTFLTTDLASLCVIIAFASAASRLVMLHRVWGGKCCCSPVTYGRSSPVPDGCFSPGVGMSSFDVAFWCVAELFPSMSSYDNSSLEIGRHADERSRWRSHSSLSVTLRLLRTCLVRVIYIKYAREWKQ